MGQNTGEGVNGSKGTGVGWQYTLRKETAGHRSGKGKQGGSDKEGGMIRGKDGMGKESTGGTNESHTRWKRATVLRGGEQLQEITSGDVQEVMERKMETGKGKEQLRR
jgi:hypothetical protein